MSLNIVNVCALNFLLPIKSGYAFVSTDSLSQTIFQLTTSLSNAILKYENLLIMGNFDIDMKSKSLGYDKIDEFCDLFNLTNLIESETCFTKNHKSLIGP